MNAEGRELPHWDMFKRRLWRTPGRWAIAQGLVWLVLTLWFPWEWCDEAIPRGVSWKSPDGSEIVLCCVMLLGFTLLYFIIANSMTALADIGGNAGWFDTALSSSNALNGVLLVTLAQSSVTIVGLLAIISTQMIRITDHWTILQAIRAQLGGDIYSFYPFTSLLLLRLPHFALACACFSIAFRQARLRQLMPLVLTLCASAAAVMSSKDVYLIWHNPYGHRYDSATTTLFSNNLLFLPIIGIVVIFLLCIGLIKLARNQQSVYLALFVLSPLALAFAGGITNLTLKAIQYSQSQNHALEHVFSHPWLQPIHIALTHIFPNLVITWRDYSNGVSHSEVLGVSVQSYGPWIWPVASYLISLVIWYYTALACLNAARFPTLPWRKLLSR